jgi:hypothetical protein
MPQRSTDHRFLRFTLPNGFEFRTPMMKGAIIQVFAEDTEDRTDLTQVCNIANTDGDIELLTLDLDEMEWMQQWHERSDT